MDFTERPKRNSDAESMVNLPAKSCAAHCVRTGWDIASDDTYLEVYGLAGGAPLANEVDGVVGVSAEDLKVGDALSGEERAGHSAVEFPHVSV